MHNKKIFKDQGIVSLSAIVHVSHYTGLHYYLMS
jgi:hypothetical protein